MRRIIPLSLIALTLFGGVALADRDRNWGGRDRGDRRDDRRDRRDDRRDRRDDRHDRRDNRHSGGVVVRDQRDHNRHRRPIVRNRVYVNNGHYVFGGGMRRTYVRPVIRQRYYDVRYRPTIIVENMEPVPGYIWVRGQWNWNGYEWAWVSGHYAPDPRYSNYYDDGSFDLSVGVSGGVTVGGGY